MDDEAPGSSFREAVGEVAPLRTPTRQRQAKSREPTAGQLRRRAQAEAEEKTEASPLLTLGEVPQVAPHEVIGWKKNGIQDGVFRNLRLGRYAHESILDLHRKTVREARTALLEFFALARAKGWRNVLISHGRGERSPTPARIKSYLAHWLTELPDVLAYHSAEPRHGGAGAVYVLLRKSSSAREHNRELHGQKSDASDQRHR